MDEATFRRRLAAWRDRAVATEGRREPDGTTVRQEEAREERLRRLVVELDGERLAETGGTVIRIEPPTRPLPLDRSLLARLPGLPPPEVPLLCLDTETTGLETGAGTLVFLVGLGWWEGQRFRQVGFLLPDEADEPGLLAALGRHIPPGARLVTYNGRAFDWPLLVARYRLRRWPPPDPVGHLDLLPLARRWFRHRLPDTRLRTVERHVLGVERVDDIEGWEIPACYRRFLLSGRAAELRRVVDHNERDVFSLARLLALLAERYADPSTLEDGERVPIGDLAALARSFRRVGRLGDALACLDTAARLAGEGGVLTSREPAGPTPVEVRRPTETSVGVTRGGARLMPSALAATLAAERARLLGRLGEVEAALVAWSVAARGSDLGAAEAWIEIAKLHEWRRRDLAAALGAVGEAWRRVERARALGLPTGRLEADLDHRAARLRRRLIAARRTRGGPSNRPVAPSGALRPGAVGPTASSAARAWEANPPSSGTARPIEAASARPAPAAIPA